MCRFIWNLLWDKLATTITTHGFSSFIKQIKIAGFMLHNEGKIGTIWNGNILDDPCFLKKWVMPFQCYDIGVMLSR